MTNLSYPKCVTAALAQENSQWKLGDALLEECGPPSEQGERDGSRARLEEVAVEITESGGDEDKFTPMYLSRLRQVAHCFSERTRRVLSWSIHEEAGSPDVLDKIIKLAGGAKHVTRDGVRKYLGRQRGRDDRQMSSSKSSLQKHGASKEKKKGSANQADFWELMGLVTAGATAVEEFEEKYKDNTKILDRETWHRAITEQMVININEWKRILDKVNAAHGRHRPQLKVVS